MLPAEVRIVTLWPAWSLHSVSTCRQACNSSKSLTGMKGAPWNWIVG
ncbi:hypothetical protein SXCC_01467 [Gluconacetobacter sp. SXCC-1]|nr:hypothetical protein SXCC_01467 [Gluconacetobacter sp. SXCC-1]